MNIKKGDNVIVISGKSKGKTGKVLEAIPSKNLVVVEGANLQKRHQRPRKSGTKGQIVDKTMPLHVSNVMLVEGGKRVRTGKKLVSGKYVRISRKSGKEI